MARTARALAATSSAVPRRIAITLSPPIAWMAARSANSPGGLRSQVRV